MKVMTNVAFHIKVHGLFISGLDAVAKADNAPGSFLIICCDIAVGAICRCYIISIEEFVEQGRLEIAFAVKFRVKVLYEGQSRGAPRGSSCGPRRGKSLGNPRYQPLRGKKPGPGLAERRSSLLRAC